MIQTVRNFLTLCYLNKGIVSRNSHHRLIVGPEGTGKSSFVHALCLAGQISFPKVLSIYVDILKAYQSMTLSGIIFNGLIEAQMIEANGIEEDDFKKIVSAIT